MYQAVSRVLFGVFFLVLVYDEPSLGFADDWFQVDFPYVVANPLRLTKGQWGRFSVAARDYRTAQTRELGDDFVFRSKAVLSNAFLTVPDWLIQPYLGGGIGFGLTNLRHEDIVRRPVLQESLIWQVGGALAYHVRQRFSLVGSIHFVNFQSFDAPGIGSATPVEAYLAPSEQDTQLYTMSLNVRFQF